LGHGDPQTLKIQAKVANGITATELDDTDTLACAVDTRGKVIELGHFGGKVRHTLRIGPTTAELSFTAKVRLCRWPIIETEYSFNDTIECERYLHWSGAPSIKSARVSIDGKSNAKGFAEIRDCARQIHRSRSEVPAHSTQAVPTCEPNHFLDVRRIRAVRGRKRFAREVVALTGQPSSQFVKGRQSFHRGTRPKNQGDLNTTERIGLTHNVSFRHGFNFATGNGTVFRPRSFRA
jgi:hypothetical protein